MTDQAIDFPKQYKPLTEAATAKVKESIQVIRDNEKITVKTLDNIVPQIVGSVCGGDNIAIVNQLLTALKGERRKVAVQFLTKFVPHEYKAEQGKFGKKLAGPKANAKINAFRKWEATGQLYSEWGERNIEVKAKEVDYGKRLERDVRMAIEKGGLSVDQVLAIVQAAAMTEAVAA